MALLKSHFNEASTKQLASWVRKSYRDHKLYNERIYTAYVKAEVAIDYFEKRERDYSAADVRSYLENGGFSDKLLPFFVKHIEARRKAAGDDLGKLQTVGVYESTIKVLRLYLRSIHRLSDAVTDTVIDHQYWTLGKLTKKDVLDLKAWLETQYAKNSIHTYLSKLRHVLFQAAEVGLVSFEKFPMRGVTVGTSRKKVARLQEDEIEKLASEFIEKKHAGKRKAITSPEHARPLAMAMYLVHGARLGDAITWRIENYVIEGNQHRLQYITSKSKKPMSVLLNDQAVELLKPYLVDQLGRQRPKSAFLFPYLPDDFDNLPTKSQYIQLHRAKLRARHQIVRLGERIGLSKRVTPHVMRHSFADMMRRAGVNLETRQEVLGHSDSKTTRNYEEQFDQEAVDQVSELYTRGRKKLVDNSLNSNPII